MIEICYHGITKRIEADERKSILELVMENFECSFSPCAKSISGQGNCGRCKVRVSDGNYTKTILSCHTKAEDGIHVEVDFLENVGKILTNVVNDGEENLPQSAIAIDLGSTTIVAQYNQKTVTCMNPQRKFGSDVVSRMTASIDGKRRELSSITIDALHNLIQQVDQEHTTNQVILAANTVMNHLLRGYSCEKLGKYPFEPVSLAGEAVWLGEYQIYTIPGISAFVGGDLMSGLFHIESHFQDSCYLLLDIGTNGEVILKKEDRFLGISTAAGPVFEGNFTAQMPGTDMIALIARMRRHGILDDSGLLGKNWFEEGYRIAPNVVMTQKNIREIQMGKAAIFGGIQELLKVSNTSYSQIEHVYLAGGFGYYLNPEDAFTVGLLPEEFRGKIISAGNTSLLGAVEMSQMDFTKACEKIQKIQKCSSALSLAQMEHFGETYFQAINFPKA